MMNAQPERAEWPPIEARAYPKPPILEAIVELRFSEPLNKRTLDRVSKRIGKGYNTATAEKEVVFGFNVARGAAEVASEAPRHRHASDDQADIFIGRAASLIWSRLAPYEGWEKFASRLKREALTAFSIIGPRKLDRVGMRYINRLDVPKDPASGFFKYEDYITINLGLPDFMDPLSGYQWHIERAFPESGLKAMMRSASLTPEIPDTLALLLDIDVAMHVDIPVKIDDILKRLEGMRELKNALFETAITDLARKAFG